MEKKHNKRKKNNGIGTRFQKETHGSDHQSLTLWIRGLSHRQPSFHVATSLKDLKPQDFEDFVKNQLSSGIPDHQTKEDIDNSLIFLTDTLKGGLVRQGRQVRSNEYLHKALWDKSVLKPLVKQGNRARLWMVLSRSPEATECYWEWNKYVKHTINKLKRKHWRASLAKSNGNLTFKAFAYTKQQCSGEVAPLLQQDGTVAIDKEEKAC